MNVRREVILLQQANQIIDYLAVMAMIAVGCVEETGSLYDGSDELTRENAFAWCRQTPPTSADFSMIWT